MAKASPTRCAPRATTPVRNGRRIVVSLPRAPRFVVGRIPASWWPHPPVSAVTWRLAFQSLAWLTPLAQRAADDRQRSALAAIVGQVATFHRQNPDPGTNASGWDEGTAMRRLQAENCLYRLTHDRRLRAAMAADVNVQFSNRYYGPPRFPVHNHGELANLMVLDAAHLLGRLHWRDKVLARVRSEAPRAWTRIGHVVGAVEHLPRPEHPVVEAGRDAAVGVVARRTAVITADQVADGDGRTVCSPG